MKADTIKAIFTNLLFVIGVILTIYGFINGSLTTARLVTFEKYPLNSYDETRCEVNYKTPVVVDSEAALSEEELDELFENCQTQLEYDRKVRKLEDIVGSATTLAMGAVLVFSFRKFIYGHSLNK